MFGPCHTVPEEVTSWSPTSLWHPICPRPSGAAVPFLRLEWTNGRVVSPERTERVPVAGEGCGWSPYRPETLPDSTRAPPEAVTDFKVAGGDL